MNWNKQTIFFFFFLFFKIKKKIEIKNSNCRTIGKSLRRNSKSSSRWSYSRYFIFIHSCLFYSIHSCLFYSIHSCLFISFIHVCFIPFIHVCFFPFIHVYFLFFILEQRKNVLAVCKQMPFDLDMSVKAGIDDEDVWKNKHKHKNKQT